MITKDAWKEYLLENKTSLGQFEKKTYIITSAQIGTKVHEGFLSNLELLAEQHDAEKAADRDDGRCCRRRPEFGAERQGQVRQTADHTQHEAELEREIG